MRVSVLCSGSSGNSIVVQCNGNYFLIEAGISPLHCSRLLHKHDLRLASIHGVICSHGHSDHYRYIQDYARRGIRGGIGPTGVSVLDGFVDCRAFAVPHDSSGGTYGFHITERGTNAALAIIMDAGSWNKDMRDAANASDVVLIGVDYDDTLVENGNYNDSLKDRIASNTGHMSNQALQDFVHRDWNGRAHTWILAHLSEKRNNPTLAYTRFMEVCRPDCKPFVIVSTKDAPTALISVELI